ncbi:hypothetical protein [Thioclava kandeliae]|uniref:SnoaL-like domain-containing protein n=1 Tax=Thioclava kandeliae TaxID=3070818 RepID=A0ABV1SBW4_9RHOB
MVSPSKPAAMAMAMAQTFLDENVEALLSNDFEAIRRMCSLPFRLETMDKKRILRTTEGLKTASTACYESLRSRNISHIIRRCLEAAWCDPETICVLYETRYVSGGRFLTYEPYLSLATLRLEEGRWKLSSMQFASDEAEPIIRLVNHEL